MPAYYPDDEEEDLAAPERGMEEDYLPTQAQAIALDQQFSQQLPQPNFDSGSQMGPVQISGPIGNATREYLTGKPGLFVQGGPSVPAGMIQVNGQIERSQAAPQPVPWWITQADEFKEQRRQEDFLRGLVSQTGKSGPAAIERMQQLQGRLQLQADIKSGMPLRDALVKNAANLYAGSRGPLTSLARLSTPPAKAFSPTEFTTPSGQKMTQVSPNRFIINQPETSAALTPSQQGALISRQMSVVAKQLEDPAISRDPTQRAALNAELADLKAQSKALLPRSKAATQAEPATQTQTGPRSALANQLVKEHPEWSDAQIFAEVKKRLNLK